MNHEEDEHVFICARRSSPRGSPPKTTAEPAVLTAAQCHDPVPGWTRGTRPRRAHTTANVPGVHAVAPSSHPQPGAPGSGPRTRIPRGVPCKAWRAGGSQRASIPAASPQQDGSPRPAGTGTLQRSAPAARPQTRRERAKRKRGEDRAGKDGRGSVVSLRLAMAGHGRCDRSPLTSPRRHGRRAARGSRTHPKVTALCSHPVPGPAPQPTPATAGCQRSGRAKASSGAARPDNGLPSRQHGHWFCDVISSFFSLAKLREKEKKELESYILSKSN